MNQTKSECSFSLELKSKQYIKTINIVNGAHESVLVEGTIGEFQHAEFAEGIVLEVNGTKGVFRIDLSREQIRGENKMEVKKQ